MKLRTQYRTFPAVVLAALLATTSIATPAFADANPPVTYGGWGALGGSLGFAVLGASVGGLAHIIYEPPRDLDCTTQPRPKACRPTLVDHLLVGTLTAAAIGGVYLSGWGSGKLAKAADFDPLLGWTLAGGYLGLPTTIFLQDAIPDWKPSWSRQALGIVLSAGGAIAAAFAFRKLAQARGNAWPEFGFGAGGMAVGMTVGVLVAPNTRWTPVLGGIGSVLGASLAALLL